MNSYSLDPLYACLQDESDPLKDFRRKFFIPKQHDGHDAYYFSGNSLGAQPKTASSFAWFILPT